MSDTLVLKRAREAIQRGDKTTSQWLLYQAVRQNPGNETAWLWLSTIVDDPQKEKDCLERVLAINPDNSTAFERWLALESPVLDAEIYPQESPGVLERSEQIG
jgi:hypothetical protein